MMVRDRDRRYSSASEALEEWRKVCKAMGNAPRPAPRSIRRSTSIVDHEEAETAGTFSESASSVGSFPFRR
jgi:hypothetical protein